MRGHAVAKSKESGPIEAFEGTQHTVDVVVDLGERALDALELENQAFVLLGYDLLLSGCATDENRPAGRNALKHGTCTHTHTHTRIHNNNSMMMPLAHRARSAPFLAEVSLAASLSACATEEDRKGSEH